MTAPVAPMAALPGATLLVVTGYPASGKTTLARRLGELLGVPVISKDDIKEPLGEVLGTGDVEWSHKLGQATYAVMFSVVDAILSSGQSVLVEANFEAKSGGNSIRRLVAEHGVPCARVVMTADGEVLLQRYRDRAAAGERHPVHLDAQNEARLAELVCSPYEPPDVPGPLIEVDGDDLDAVDVRAIARSVVEALSA